MSCKVLLAADHPIPQRARRDSQHIDLSPVPTAVREARSFVRARAGFLGGDQLQDLLMLTSELVTNAVLHARTVLDVALVVTDAAVLVCVGDGSPGRPEFPPLTDHGENGRGMMLVRALADDWGVLAEKSSEGKAVWFLLRRREDFPARSGSGSAGADG
jgi:anti-sigma regulatory factor (Ser/Thr protein kinase)